MRDDDGLSRKRRASQRRAGTAPPGARFLKNGLIGYLEHGAESSGCSLRTSPKRLCNRLRRVAQDIERRDGGMSFVNLSVEHGKERQLRLAEQSVLVDEMPTAATFREATHPQELQSNERLHNRAYQAQRLCKKSYRTNGTFNGRSGAQSRALLFRTNLLTRDTSPHLLSHHAYGGSAYRC